MTDFINVDVALASALRVAGHLETRQAETVDHHVAMPSDHEALEAADLLRFLVAAYRHDIAKLGALNDYLQAADAAVRNELEMCGYRTEGKSLKAAVVEVLNANAALESNLEEIVRILRDCKGIAAPIAKRISDELASSPSFDRR